MKHVLVSTLVILVLSGIIHVVTMIIKASGGGWANLQVVPRGSSPRNALLVDNDELQYSPLDEHLPLFDWEYETNGSERVCSPPLDVPDYCCVGSGMIRGFLLFTQEQCLNSPENLRLPYDQVQNHSIDYLRHLPLSPSSGVRACDVCQIVHVLMTNNLSLAFEGDSVTRQTFAGLECELRRRRYNVTRTYDDFIAKNRKGWRKHWRATTELIVIRGNKSTTIRHFEFFQPELKAVRAIIDRYHIDILMFDNGLHYLTTQLGIFKKEVAELLQILATKVPLLIWRETSTQHYLSTGGHYEGKQQLSCSRINGSDITNTSFHKYVVLEVVSSMDWSYVYTSEPDFVHKPVKNDSHELVIIPFRQYTIPLYNVHPSANDCTHFCSTPYLWLPIWRSLRLAIDRLVVQTGNASLS